MLHHAGAFILFACVHKVVEFKLCLNSNRFVLLGNRKEIEMEKRTQTQNKPAHPFPTALFLSHALGPAPSRPAPRSAQPFLARGPASTHGPAHPRARPEPKPARPPRLPASGPRSSVARSLAQCASPPPSLPGRTHGSGSSPSPRHPLAQPARATNWP